MVCSFKGKVMVMGFFWCDFFLFGVFVFGVLSFVLLILFF